MTDYIYVGSAPTDEDCVQVTRDADYLPAMRAECLRYIAALRAKYGPEPEGAELRLKREGHDFGPYIEVVCVFDPTDDAAVEYAYDVEGGLQFWPEEI